MQILNALDLKKGKKVQQNRLGSLTRPLQFLPQAEKDEQWAISNLDWLEWQGVQQIRQNAKRLQKNYELAEGIINRQDYIVDEDNQYADLVKILTRDQDSPLELKFYPIIPNVLRILIGEFAKRVSKISFYASDDLSHNQLLEEKRQMVEATLLQVARQKQTARMVSLGIDVGSQEGQEELSTEKIRSLPEIESFFRKDYQSIHERWANVQYRVDQERFSMAELELTAFKDMLITDREFWHFKMMQNDYQVELWDPRFVFLHKSPSTRYTSQGNYVGKIDLCSIADVIDQHGYLMSADQLARLEGIYPVHSTLYNQPLQNDGSLYDATRSHAWNTNLPSLGMRQYTSSHQQHRPFTDNEIEKILQGDRDIFDASGEQMIRVTTAYWKSQRKVGHLTKITDEGEVIQRVVTEAYKITDKPVYNTTVVKEKNRDTLVFGEHIDWIWINDVYGGIKIGANRTSWMGQSDETFEPIYLGIDARKPGRLRFQFKGDSSLYGCKLPVEGRIFSDRNTRSTALVDLMKPFQVQYNLVNNQIADILVDELGTVVVVDQNALPRHSLGEDWGRGNFAKAYVAMKNFQMLPLDTTISNTENPINFNHWQTLNLEQTNRLLSRVNLATYFKEQAFEVVGITPQRRGQEVGRQSVRGLEENLSASYAQTEIYFLQHSDQLMPRVHAMRTDLAQFYHSSNPSLRLQYMTSLDERVNFEMNGCDLLLSDFNVYCTTNTNHRAVMEQLRQLALNNNTTGATIFDLGNVVKAESLSELEQAMQAVEEKIRQQREADMQHQSELEAQQQQADLQRMREEEDRQDRREAARNQTSIVVAEIRAAGYGAMKDIDNNQQSDYLDALEQIRKQEEYQDTMNFKRQQEFDKKQLAREQMNIKRQELNSREKIADKQLQIARENKNRYDVQKKAK